MKFLHKAKVIHRDLKPANILINSFCQVTICDFGCATVSLGKPDKSKDISEEKTSDDCTIKKELKVKRKHSDHVTTRVYRAPEVITLMDYDKKVDNWAVGCILAELIWYTNAYRSINTEPRFLFPGKSCFPLSPLPGSDGVPVINNED